MKLAAARLARGPAVVRIFPPTGPSLARWPGCFFVLTEPIMSEPTAPDPNPDLGEPPLLEIAAGVARITLRRPRLHNRFEVSDIPLLTEQVARLAADPAVRVVVFTGTGPKTFSSGFNIEAIVGHLDPAFENFLDAVEALPMATIAALNGGVYGGATDLALACDFRIGVTGSRMFMPALKFGLHYYPGGIRRYVTRLGLTQAKKLFLTALPIDAVEMLRIGYLTELVEPAALAETVQRYVDAIVATEPVVAARMKAHLNAFADGCFDLERASADYAAALASDTLRQRLSTRK